MSQTSTNSNPNMKSDDGNLLVDTIEQKVTIGDSTYKFEYGIFEVVSSDVDEVAKNFFRKSKSDSDILPPVTRWVSKKMTAMAVERPPFTVSITYDDIHFEEEPINSDMQCEDCDPEHGCCCGWESDNLEYQSFEFTINIPWTIWFFSFNDLKEISESFIFCSHNSIQSNDTPLLKLPLTNIYDNHQICWGSSLMSPKKYSNFSSYILGSINSFWISRFNNDLTCNIGSLDLGSFSSTRDYLEMYSKLSMEEVLSADLAKVELYNENGTLKDFTFGEFCEKMNKTESINMTPADNSNRVSKFFKELTS